MFKVVRPKKMTYVHLVCIITYDLQVKSQRKVYKLMLRVISLKNAELLRFFDPFYSAQHLVFIGQGVDMISLESRDIYIQK